MPDAKSGTKRIVELDRIDALIEPFDWAFARDHVREIEAYWERETSGKLGFYDGEVLIQHRGAVEGRVFQAGYSITRYKPFFAWQRMGHPGAQVRNGFAMAALRARDGAYLLGVMSAHTANAGRVYFAAGTPDRGDIVDGQVDLLGSVVRELSEETGLTVEDVAIGEGWTAVLGASNVAFMRPVMIDCPARDARQLILDRMKALPEQELSDIVVVGGPQDIDPVRMPAFQVAYLEWVFRCGA